MSPKILVVALVVFGLAVVMTMTGRGGGNFYVLTLVLAGLPMHQAAAVGQCVLFATGLTAAVVFKKAKTLSVPLALFLAVFTSGMAFLGGYFSYLVGGRALKLLFAGLLTAAGVAMLFTVERARCEPVRRLGYWNLEAGGETCVVNLWLAVPLASATGFFSGMVGVSGGSFLVPLMVLGFGVPMRTAVGTASALVAATAFAGFTGHALQGAFLPSWGLPAAGGAVLGGLAGGKLALRAKPKYLKRLFAVTTLIAAGIMFARALFH